MESYRSSASPVCLYTQQAICQVPSSGSATLIGHLMLWEGLFFFFSAAVAMEAHRVDDGLGVSAHPLKAPLVWLAEESWCRKVHAQTEAHGFMQAKSQERTLEVRMDGLMDGRMDEGALLESHQNRGLK